MIRTEFFILVVLLITVSAVQVSAQEWNGEPSKIPIYHDPVREYYDAKQKLSTYPTEPVFYPGLYIEPLNEVSCGWVPVYGIVPKDGILTFTIVSGDFIGWHNVSHNSQFNPINYFYLPCDGIGEEVTLRVYFIFNDPYDQEYHPNTKVKDMGFISGALHRQQTFTVR